MKRKMLSITTLIVMIIISLFSKVFAAEAGTIRMEIKSGTEPWTEINISDSYNECQSLNSTTSTLGTTMLKAHLTTDADWSAMAIFSAGQYGGSITNTPTSTNGNLSGVYDVGTKYTQTTGILKTTHANTNIYVNGLFNSDGSVKPYIRQWDVVSTQNRDQTNFVGFMNSGTFGKFGSNQSWGEHKSCPISIKKGLFGVLMGLGAGYAPDNSGQNGAPYNTVTFRPVIWN